MTIAEQIEELEARIAVLQADKRKSNLTAIAALQRKLAELRAK